MKRLANSYPVLISLGIVAIYFAIFAAPALWSSSAFGGDPTMTPRSAPTGQLKLEIFLAASVVALVFLMGWGRSARVTSRPAWGGLWYMLFPVVVMLALLGAGVLAAQQNGLDATAIFASGLLWSLVPLVILVGIYEEVLFRGIVLHGLEARIGAVAALFVSSALFGSMHYVNWIEGQDFAGTTRQVIHAGLAGILYGALALRTRSVWPGALLHALWDLTVTLNGALVGGMFDTVTEEDTGPSILGFAIENFEPIFGLIVLLSWLRWRRGLED